MSLPDLLLSNPPSLSERLRCRTNELRSRIVRTNYNTKFAQTAPELADFRHAMAGDVNGIDGDALSESFRQTVPFTGYNSYAPLIERFTEKPCRVDAIVDLLAPGLPDYLGLSSSTSGGVSKTIPRYNCMPEIRSQNASSWTISDPSRRRTKALLCYLRSSQVNVEDEDNCVVKTIYVTCTSVITLRKDMHLVPEQDEEKMGAFILDHAAPYAAGFITKYRSFLLIHTLFALGSRALESMDMLFISTFLDMIRLLDMEFDMVVDCIANGTIPDLEGITDIRHHLEPNFSPDPERAAELRRFGRPSSRQGWCGHVWPNLRLIIAIASGSFALSLPSARWFLDPSTDIVGHGYGSTEAWIGSPYSPHELNQFKPSNDTVFEFLDISKNDSISSVVQPWEVESGRRYELVLTTANGLWRYRLGDVVEISGFDPTDGDPIIQFVERRNVVIRFPDIMITEKELKAVVSSMRIKVVNWTSTVDDRCVPDTVGFFVELAGDQHEASELALAPERALDELSRLNGSVALALADDLFRKPTIRLVRPGTFRDFLQLKLDEGSDNLGQIKVPVVLPKATYVSWLLDQVVQEL